MALIHAAYKATLFGVLPSVTNSCLCLHLDVIHRSQETGNVGRTDRCDKCCVRPTQATHREIITFKVCFTHIKFMKGSTGNIRYLLGQDEKMEDVISLFCHEIRCNFAQEWTKHIDKFKKKLV